jgi:hypothetical protein
MRARECLGRLEGCDWGREEVGANQMLLDGWRRDDCEGLNYVCEF